MTIKEILRGYRNLCAHIKRTEEKIQELQHKAMIPAPPDVDGVKVKTQPKRDPMGDIVSKYIDLIKKLEKDQEEEVEQFAFVWEIIQSLEPKGRLLMHMRYINGNSWEQIAVDMGYSIHTIWKLHGEYLTILEKNSKKQKSREK